MILTGTGTTALALALCRASGDKRDASKGRAVE